ncbi:MAG: hypothetical protein RCG15_04440 [Candidatus Rickettsia vulgarisii]
MTSREQYISTSDNNITKFSKKLSCKLLTTSILSALIFSSSNASAKVVEMAEDIVTASDYTI